MKPSADRIATRWLRARAVKPGLRRVNDEVFYWNTWAKVEPGFKVPNADPRDTGFEKIFEEVRREVNPAAPSRLACVFVCPRLNKGFCGSSARNDFTYRVRVTGTTFTTDGGLWSRARSARSIGAIRSYAEEYWNAQGNVTHDGEEEMLVKGKVIVEALELPHAT